MRTGLIGLSLAVLALFVFGHPARAEVCTPPPPRDSTVPVNDCDAVVQVVCRLEDGNATFLTGFVAKVDGTVGIVTALHGVVGCVEGGIDARNEGNNFPDLHVELVDIPHDTAFLTPDREALTVEGLEPLEGDLSDQGLRVVGYPQGIIYQRSHTLSLSYQPIVLLDTLLPSAAARDLEERGSPDLERSVLSLDGPLQVGYSGAPILTVDEGLVVGVANGGLGESIGWAMPFEDLDWRDHAEHADTLGALADKRVPELFGVTAAQAETAVPLLVTDWRLEAGKIFHVANGKSATWFERDDDGVGSIAVGPNGDVWFTDYEAGHLFRIVGGKAQKEFFNVSADIHKVVIDDHGIVYFSVPASRNEDGAIYRYDPVAGSVDDDPFVVVRRGDVGGSWDGDFAFASTSESGSPGTLWLSTGQKVPASIYEVADGVTPELRFTSGEPIAGLTFAEDGDLYYSDWGQKVYRIEMPGLIASEVVDLPGLQWAADVAVAPADLVVSITVPKLTGMSAVDAEASAIAAGLEVVRVESFDPEVPVDHVIAQDPGPDATLERGGSIELTISLGASPVTVPDVVGLTESEALASLTDVGLNGETSGEQNDSTHEVGQVIRTDPAVGASATVGSTVDLVVSLGPAVALVPELTGMAVSDARRAIEDAGLAVGETVGAINGAARDTVLGQRPRAGSSAPSGAEIHIEVSSGPELERLDEPLVHTDPPGTTDFQDKTDPIGPEVRSLAFDPKGDTLLSAGEPSTLRLWDRLGMESLRDYTGHHEPVFSATFSPDGTLIASGSSDLAVRLYGAEQGHRTKIGTLSGHMAKVRDVAFSPDGVVLASADQSGVIILWDVHDQAERFRESNDAVSVRTIAFSPDGKRFVSGDELGRVRLWDWSDDAPWALTDRDIEFGHLAAVTGVAFSDDGSLLSTGSLDGELKVWSARRGQLRVLQELDHGALVWDVAFSPDGLTVASAGGDGKVKLWDVATGTRYKTLFTDSPELRSVDFDAAGSVIAAGGIDGKIWLWQSPRPG
jgi:beta-lactam-binding protein with PASTA domain